MRCPWTLKTSAPTDRRSSISFRWKSDSRKRVLPAIEAVSDFDVHVDEFPDADLRPVKAEEAPYRRTKGWRAWEKSAKSHSYSTEDDEYLISSVRVYHGPDDYPE